MRKFVFSFFPFLVVLFACQDIPRDSLLDPKNPESYTQSTIFMEAFVSTAENLPASYFNYNRWALQALDSIQHSYGNQVIIAEYHRNAGGYQDTLSILASEMIYEKYVNNASSQTKGMPDIFINGLTGRVQGASGVHSVVNRLHAVLTDLIIQQNHFTLEAGPIQFSGSQLTASCKIARLGDQSAENLLLKMILINNLQSPESQRVVAEVKKSETIPLLEAGEIITRKFEEIPVSRKPDYLLFCLTSTNEITVFQSIKVAVR